MKSSKEKYTLEQILIKNSPITQKVLRGYIERHKVIPYKCEVCGCDGALARWYYFIRIRPY